METSRVTNHEALETFIQTQKNLLAQTQADIEKLRQLRSTAISQPATLLEVITQDLVRGTRLLGDQPKHDRPILPQIDWTLYKGHDTTPLQRLASSVRANHVERNQPLKTQKSSPSDLQKLVREAKRSIIDPVLPKYECLAEPDDDSEPEEVDPEEMRREEERQKIRELKKREIRSCGLKLPGFRARASTGVFIRRDIDDESMEVDISLDDKTPKTDPIIDSLAPKTSSFELPPQIPLIKVPRSRRPTTKIRALEKSHPPPDAKNKLGTNKPPSTKIPTPKTTSASKPKPETYKQAWSVSEQHLLERLLEQIPDGEKNRWQKISRAMNGRRTPRQVASRVQKYFEKLKRFGLGMDKVGIA
ncbi:hypothetical protein BD779DRAFT_1508803 [Infundibulicybe gibba]|nr:hypothetical protein BD779DRAFT_1508803 [Infundibulicybe gibba]